MNDVLFNFIKNGYHSFGNIFSKTDCSILLSEIKKEKDFGAHMFLSKEEFYQNEIRYGVNPRKGFSLLEKLNADFVYKNPTLLSSLRSMLGDDFEVVINKIICGVPYAWLPKYVIDEVNNAHIPNLGAYVKPEYRDITYFEALIGIKI